VQQQRPVAALVGTGFRNFSEWTLVLWRPFDLSVAQLGGILLIAADKKQRRPEDNYANRTR
jgi:hypothetical protein